MIFKYFDINFEPFEAIPSICSSEILDIAHLQDLYEITLAATAITGMAAAGGVEGGWRGANVTINLLSYPF